MRLDEITKEVSRNRVEIGTEPWGSLILSQKKEQKQPQR